MQGAWMHLPPSMAELRDRGLNCPHSAPLQRGPSCTPGETLELGGLHHLFPRSRHSMPAPGTVQAGALGHTAASLSLPCCL